MNISVGRAAKLIGTKRNAVYQMIESDTLPYECGVVFGRKVYQIPLADLHQWMEREKAVLRNRTESRIAFLSRSQKQIQEVLKHG